MWWWCWRRGWADGKVVIERLCLYLPHVDKPFNLKVIKSFVPELRSRKVFRASRLLCNLYMSYEHSMYISHIRIHIWLCNICTKLLLPSLNLRFRHEEGETQFFYADCSSIVSFQPTDSTNAHAHPAVHKLTDLAQVQKMNSLRLSTNLNSLLLLKITPES